MFPRYLLVCTLLFTSLLSSEKPNLYISKRTSRALKVKTFHDTECIVVGYKQGKGKYTGLLGSLNCKLPKGIDFFIGTGFSDTMRKNPPKLGTQITFKYKEYTKAGKPRFPVFLRVR